MAQLVLSIASRVKHFLIFFNSKDSTASLVRIEQHQPYIVAAQYKPFRWVRFLGDHRTSPDSGGKD